MYCVSLAFVLVLSITNLCDSQKVYPIVSGWYQDRRVFYYDFGASSAQSGGTVAAIPIYAFITGFSGTEPIFVPGQFNVVSKKPGMPGYSDLWLVNLVTVNASYVANSIRDEATILANYPSRIVVPALRNCPIVPSGSSLEGGEFNLTKGWFNNEEVVYFDFGVDSPNAIPIWVPVDKYNVHHGNNLINSIPGSSGYSHFWKVSFIDVPVDLNDNALRSFTAATNSKFPLIAKDLVVNCPVVRVDPVNSFYLTVGWYKGRKSYYYDFGARSPLVGSKVKAIPIYVVGTNTSGNFVPVPNQRNIISFNLADGPAYSDLWQVYFAVVPTTYVANTFKSEEQVLSSAQKITKSDILVNCPVVPDGSVLRDGGPDITLGWYKGVQVSYFDFGADSGQPIPIWPFIRPDGLQAGNNVIDSIPDDAGYSAFWDVRKVDVPLAYTNNLVRSAAGVASNGLVATKINVVVNCPVIRTDPPTVNYLVTGWYKQRKALYWDFGPSGIPRANGQFLTNDVFVFVNAQNTPITTMPPVFRYPKSSSNYSDICTLYYVTVGASFTGSVTSVAALVAAFPPQNLTKTDLFWNSPQVPENSTLEGIPGVPVPLATRGFSNGSPVWYFFFRTTPNIAIPIWAMFNPAGLHVGNNVIDSIPSDAGYSDIWRVRKVSTTSIYTSSDVLRSQTEIAQSGFGITTLDLFVNCPYYTSDPDVPANYFVRGWYKDRRSYYYDFGPRSEVSADKSTVVSIPIYAFITGKDAQGKPIFVAGQNNVLSKTVGDAGYSDLWQVTFVQVPASYVANSIKSESAILAQYSANLSQGPLVNCPVVASADHVLANGGGNIVKGWYKDQAVFYFDFGPSPAFTIPIWVFKPADGAPIGRFMIDKIQTEPGYSAFWRVNFVTVPSTFMPDSIRSLTALQASGYTVTPQDIVVNCPVVYTDTNLVALDSNTDTDLALKGFRIGVDLVPIPGGLTNKLTVNYKYNAASSTVDFAVRGYNVSGYVAIGWAAEGTSVGTLMAGAEAVHGFISAAGVPTVGTFALTTGTRGGSPITTLQLTNTNVESNGKDLTLYFTRPFDSGALPLSKTGTSRTFGSIHTTAKAFTRHNGVYDVKDINYVMDAPAPTPQTPTPTSPPAGSNVDPDLAAKGFKVTVILDAGKLAVSYKYNQASKTVDFALRSTGVTGYVAIGWPKAGVTYENGSPMIGADSVICNFTAGQAVIRPYMLAQFTAGRGPVPPTSFVITDTSGDTANGVQTFYFSRTFATGSNPLSETTTTPTIWAYGNSQAIGYHSMRASAFSNIDYMMDVPATPPPPGPPVDADLAAKGFKSAVILDAGKLTLNYKYNQASKTIDFALRSTGITGYVAVGWPKAGVTYENGSPMIGADTVICNFTAGQAVIRPYMLAQFTAGRGPVPPTSFVITATSGDTANGVQTFYFTRTFATGSNPLSETKANPTIWAYGNSQSIGYHSMRASAFVNINYALDVPVTPPPPPTGPPVDADLAAKGFKVAVVLEAGKLTLNYKYNQASKTVDVALRSTGISGYVAIGWPKAGVTYENGSPMIGADSVICNFTAGQAVIRPYMLAQFTAGRGPVPPTSFVITATSGDVTNGVQTFYFTRTFATGSNPLSETTTSPTIWAYHTTNQAIGYHSVRSSAFVNPNYASDVSIPTSPTPSPTPSSTPITPPAPSSGSVDADLAAKGYKFAVVLAPGKVSLSFKPGTTGSIDFALRSYGGISGYVAVGWPKAGAKAEAGTLMDGADAVFGTVDASGVASVKPATLFIRGSNPSTTLTLTGTSGDTANGVQTFYFTRTFATGSNPLTEKGTNPTIYAFHQSSDNMMYHTERSNSLSLIDYVTGGSATVARGVGIREVHAILMIVSWGLCLLFGALFARFAKSLPDALWFQVHQYLQPIAYIISVVGFIIGLVMVNGAHFTPSNIAHAILGIVITALGVAQVLAGVFRPHKEEGVTEQRPARRAFEIAHPANGYLLCILAIIQIFLGIKLINWPLGAFVGYGVYVGLTLLFFIIASLTGLGVPKPKDDNYKLM